MSTHYFMYTEVNIDGTWVCINNRLKNVQKGTETLCNTYCSGSRSYFHATADKIEEIGFRISYHELSAELQAHFNWAEESIQYWNAFAVNPEDMCSCFPENSSLREFCGYVHKNTLFSYQTGDIDDIDESLSADEFLELPEEKRKCYAYYEWDSAFGWYKYFKEILEHFRWQKYEWDNSNFSCDREFEFRLILVVS
ncbi:MAG: hypothetical protein IJW29_01715 [Clostridia bacterium]|nr:hypothetical protein [Clostridia bacterium]